MLSSQELVFCQRFPFSPSAKQQLKQFSFDLAKTPEAVAKRSALMINAAIKEKPYVLDSLSSDLLIQEIQAFPIAKILVSAMDRSDIMEKFSESVSRSTLHYLSNDSHRKETAFQLANEFGLSFEWLEKDFFWVKVPISVFLAAGFKDDRMRLVHQSVENGFVFLTEAQWLHLLSELAGERVRASLPVPLEHVPPVLTRLAAKLKEQLVFRFKQSFSFAIEGEVNPNFFPPCMAKIYGDLLEGKNVPHAGRFNMATFLVALGLPTDQIVRLFEKTPNFSEKISRYQVERIAGKGNPKYAASSCSKLRAYNLCVAACPVTHPLQFYDREQRKFSATTPPKTNLANKKVSSATK